MEKEKVTDVIHEIFRSDDPNKYVVGNVRTGSDYTDICIVNRAEYIGKNDFASIALRMPNLDHMVLKSGVTCICECSYKISIKDGDNKKTLSGLGGLYRLRDGRSILLKTDVDDITVPLTNEMISGNICKSATV